MVISSERNNMVTSIDDSSFTSSAGDLDPEEASDGKDINGRVIPTLHDAHRGIDPMVGVEIEDRDHILQGMIDGYVREQEQERKPDLLLTSKCVPCGMIAEQDVIQLEDQHDFNEVLSVDNQHDSPWSKSAEFDLNKLCDLITKTTMAGSDMDGKDVILFLGITGSGKTSTMLYLAGALFAENDNGEYEIKSLPPSKRELEDYKISSRSRSCTRCLQTTTVTVDGRKVVLCDTPGFGDTEGAEFDIANGILMVQALYRAKSVKPVLVFNKGWQSDRFVSLTETLQSVLQLTGRKESLDFSSFRFVFTDCNRREVKKILKKLHDFLQDIEAPDHPHHSHLMMSMVNAMINAINAEFLYVDLAEEDASQLQLSLLRCNSKSTVTNPTDFFVPFVSEKAGVALISQLNRSMIEVDNSFSNSSYDKALPLIFQVIQVRNVMQTVKYAVPKTISSQSILQNLAERSRYHLSQALSFTSDQKVCVLSELNKVKEVNECVDLFREDSIEVGIYTNRVESHVDRLLEADKIINISSSPTEWAWKLVRLRKLATVADLFPFLNALSRRCNKDVDRIDDHVCQEIEIISAPVQSSLDGLADIRQFLVDINMFSTKVVEFNSAAPTKYCFQEKIDVFWIKTRSRLTKLSNDLNVLTDKIQDASATKNYFSITSHMVIQVGNVRSQLINAIGNKAFYKILFSDGWRHRRSLITKFDEHLILWLTMSLQALEFKVSQYNVRINSDMDFAALMDSKSSTLATLEDLQIICFKVETWQGLEQVQIHHFLTHAIQLHTRFESYIQDIDDQHKERAENCKKANKLARQFLNRIRSSNESIVNLLSELDETSSWDSWSMYDEERKVHGFVKNVFNGIKTVCSWTAINSKLKKTLDGIVITLKKHVVYHLVNLDSIEVSISEPFEAATCLLRKQHENVRLVAVLLRLRIESSLRTELIDRDISGVLSGCLLPLASSFKKISQLPLQLVEKHQFDVVGDVLSLWKAANETWKFLRSFANSPLSQDFNGGGKELQKCIRDCQDYECIVDIFFNEIKKIQLEVEASSFDCPSGSLHEKNNYYGQLEQFLGMVRGFQKHKDHATSSDFKSLLNIEHVMLSKFSFELEQMGLILMKKMDKFAIDSSCFISVNSLMSNLDCIELTFKKISPSISRQACEIKSSAQQEVENNFAKTREDVDFESTISIFEFLIKWKRAGCEVLCWRSLFYKSIDEFLASICQNSTNSSSILLELSLLLRSLKEHNAVVANLLLSEHSIFEGSMNAIFDERTAKQGIKYVIANLSSLSEVEKAYLEALYEEFESSFLEMLGEGLHLLYLDNNTEIDPTKDYFKSKVEVVMKDFDLKYSNQISQLTAVLFARWSVMSNVSLFHKITTPSEQRYLKKPHPAQVVAIWLMLNLLHGDYAVVKNILVELKTGEGKSVVLGITATILALFGFHIDCVCYSMFLSSRDYDDFRQLFECFGVLDRIHYGTIQKFAMDIMSGHYSNAESAVNGNWSRSKPRLSTSKMLRILLVDEVDVFFGKDVFGNYLNSGLSISTQTVKGLFYRAWNYKNKKQSRTYKKAMTKLIDSYPKESRNLIEKLVSNLLNEARLAKNAQTSEFFVVDNKIVQKYFDGVAEYVSNEINFFYIKYAERGEIPKTIADNKLVLSPVIGRISYAELPFEYSAILGVTGTLQGLGDSFQAILSKKYCMEKYYYVPSVFGMNRLMFSSESHKDVVISHSEADFHLELKQEILARRRPLNRESGVVRPVMVFFRSKSSLMTFYESDMMNKFKNETSIIDETMSKETRDSLFLKATGQGSITFMIRDFGRGTDFKCFDYNLQHEGGVHVIQAFFSTDQSEEVQIKGRTARHGANGSFSIIINATELCVDLRLSHDEITNIKQNGDAYSSLHNIRMKNMEQTIQSRLKEVEKCESMHYRTIACMDALRDAERCSKKDEVISFFEELNGLRKGGAFETNNKKEEKNHQGVSSLRRISDEDKQKRFSNLSVYSDDEKIKNEMARVREMTKLEDSSHYQILGIPKESLQYQIKNAIQKLSELFHPDKCYDDDAVIIMQRLNDIKDDLCCDVKRKRYDDGLKRPDQNESP